MEVKVSGTENLTHGDVDLIQQLAEKTAKRNNVLEKINVDVDTHSKTGERHLFVVNVNAQTSRGVYTSEASEWKLNIAVKDALKALEKQIVSDVERHRR